MNARLLTAFAVLAAAAGCGDSGATASQPAGSAAPKTAAFSVTSTLRGKTLIPRRIHWVARTSAAASEVRFLIDGKVRWIENTAPFSYSEEGGYLVTSWLSPGRHRFAVQATSVTGARATEAVTARVAAPPPPPAGLAGRWQRVVRESVPPDPAFPGDAVPAGRWTIVIDKRWIESHFPGKFNPATSPQTGAGNILLDDYTPGPRTFHVYGAVTTGPLNISGANPSAQGGGWWCGPGGPGGVYLWSVSGDELSLRPSGTTAAASAAVSSRARGHGSGELWRGGHTAAAVPQLCRYHEAVCLSCDRRIRVPVVLRSCDNHPNTPVMSPRRRKRVNYAPSGERSGAGVEPTNAWATCACRF